QASAAARTRPARAAWSSAVPCEKLSRTTSTPARIIRASVSAELEAGPSVATIFVARAEGLSTGSGALCGALLQDSDRGERLAFQELEEGAAAGRDIPNLVCDAVLRDRRQRITTPGNGESRRRGDGPRQRLRAAREGVELEHAHRAVPDDRARRLEQAGQALGRDRPDVQDHIVVG